jgi:hypothetical protein
MRRKGALRGVGLADVVDDGALRARQLEQRRDHSRAVDHG